MLMHKQSHLRGGSAACPGGEREGLFLDAYHQARHKAWREKVLRRAGYLCEECARYGRKTEATTAHHIKPVEEYPELRYDLKNGRALCASCHNAAHPEKGGKIWRNE